MATKPPARKRRSKVAQSVADIAIPAGCEVRLVSGRFNRVVVGGRLTTGAGVFINHLVILGGKDCHASAELAKSSCVVLPLDTKLE